MVVRQAIAALGTIYLGPGSSVILDQPLSSSSPGPCPLIQARKCQFSSRVPGEALKPLWDHGLFHSPSFFALTQVINP